MGDIAKKPCQSKRAFRKLTEPAQFFIMFDIEQTRDLPQGSTDGQVHSLSLPNNSLPEIIAVGDASWCFAAWRSSGHCFNKDILCLKFEFNTRIQRMRVIFDGMQIPAIHKQPTWMWCVCTRSCYNWLRLVRQCNLVYELPCREISNCFVKNWHGIARIMNQIPNSRNLNLN